MRNEAERVSLRPHSVALNQMKRPIHTALRAHIEVLYDCRDSLDHFVPIRGPVQDESKLSDPDEVEAQRIIEAGKYRK
jgi:hypothetical protein